MKRLPHPERRHPRHSLDINKKRGRTKLIIFCFCMEHLSADAARLKVLPGLPWIYRQITNFVPMRGLTIQQGVNVQAHAF